MFGFSARHNITSINQLRVASGEGAGIHFRQARASRVSSATIFKCWLFVRLLLSFRSIRSRLTRGFVRNFGTNPEDLAIVRAIIGLAAAFGLQLGAEGV